MKFLRFLFLNLYARQFVLAGLVLVLLFVVLIYSLKSITFHDEYKTVPSLQGISIHDIPEYLESMELRYEVIDSTKFSAKFTPLSVISHQPNAGDEVKKNRKIYLTVNPSGFRKITVPNIIQVTYRNAESILSAVGFEVGEIYYRNNIGKDMVLEIRHEGRTIVPGIALEKTSKIDIVLGNGRK